MSSIRELYEFGPCVFQGRTGQLLRGNHKGEGTSVFIKVVEVQQHPKSLEQCQLLHSLVNDSIAQVIDLREENGFLYVIMMDYGDLPSQFQPVLGRNLQVWAYELIQALDCMHRNEVTHRNITLKSIQFRGDRPVFTNFEFTEGEASASNHTHIPTKFDSPEVVNSGNYEKSASDVFSLGRVLLCLATGESLPSDSGQYNFKSDSFKDLIDAMTCDDWRKRESAAALLSYPFFLETAADEKLVELLPLVNHEGDIDSFDAKFWKKLDEDAVFMTNTSNPRAHSYSLMSRYQNPNDRPAVIRETNSGAMAKIATESLQAAVVYQYNKLYEYASYCYRRAVLATILGTDKTQDEDLKELRKTSKANLDELESRMCVDNRVTVHY